MQSTAVQHEASTSQFDANISALRKTQPIIAENVLSAGIPHALLPAVARDQTATFCWHDPDGRQRWFGRTTMPRIRGEALVESFQPGSGNVLLHGIGHGFESLLLLRKLGPHQAIAIIESDAWRVRTALSLTDVSQFIQGRQLLLFSGASAWKDAADFFADNAGFLLPTRILSWPWFEKEDVAHVSEQLRSLQSNVSNRRTALQTSFPVSANAPREGAIAIFSSHADPRSLRLSRRIESGVRALGLDSLCIVPDSPATMLTAAVQNALTAFAPGAILFVNTMPDDLPSLPLQCRIAVIAGPNWLPSEQSLTRLSENTRVFALSCESRETLFARGLSVDRIESISDAALPNLSENKNGREILILADRLEDTPESVGLHLTSHVRLWNEAKNQILNQIDTYHDGRADAVLADAEKKLGYVLDSAEVRTGLTDRIRNVLGPELVRRAYIEALAEADIPFTITGRGWQSSGIDPSIRVLDAWTVETAPTALDRLGAIVSLNSNNNSIDELLDALSGGMVAYIRNPAGDSINPNLTAIIDAQSDLQTFTNRASFIKLMNQFLADPENCKSRFAHTTEKIRTQHTWSARLHQIFTQIGHHVPAESRS